MFNQRKSPEIRENFEAGYVNQPSFNSNRNKLKLPPYGRKILEARQAGQHPDHGCLFCNFGWSESPPCKWCFCLPTDVQIESFDCRFCAGLDVFLFAKGHIESRVYEFAKHLQQFQADKILISFGEGFFRYVGTFN
jgi:hypothetical protein